jgi:signal transduction histidine kinase
VHSALDSLHDVLVLMLLAAPIGTFISSILGTGSLWLGGLIGRSSIPQVWISWWFGDMMSLFMLTPLLLTLSAWPRTRLSRKRLTELSLISVSTLVIGLFVFLGLFHPNHWQYPVIHLVFPPLTWAALRFGQRGVTAVIATFATLAIFGTVQGISPFSTNNLWLGLLFLQSFMGITTATTLIMAAIVAERHALEQRKDEFISLASHELRNPLTSLLGYTQLLQKQLAGSNHPHLLRSLTKIEMQAKKLVNLLTNAIKYSPQAKQIIVHLTSTAECLTVSVQDFGIGISTTEQEKVFERFYRVTGMQEQAVTGLGIGLYIARLIIKHYRGKLWVESRKEQGSTFSFSLPWNSPQEERSFPRFCGKIFRLINT